MKKKSRNINKNWKEWESNYLKCEQLHGVQCRTAKKWCKEIRHILELSTGSPLRTHKGQRTM